MGVVTPPTLNPLKGSTPPKPPIVFAPAFSRFFFIVYQIMENKKLNYDIVFYTWGLTVFCKTQSAPFLPCPAVDTNSMSGSGLFVLKILKFF